MQEEYAPGLSNSSQKQQKQSLTEIEKYMLLVHKVVQYKNGLLYASLFFWQIDLQAHNVAQIQDFSGSLTGLLLHDTIENEVCEKSLSSIWKK